MASLDGDSVAVIIALALYSDKHRDLVKGQLKNEKKGEKMRIMIGIRT
jgi:hypothetical protein